MKETKATIASMAINPKMSLDSATKRQLQNLIENEFCNQRSLHQSSIAEKERKILEQYKKEVGYARLKARLDKAINERREAEHAINLTGLTDTGNLCNCLNDAERKEDPKQAEIFDRVHKLIDALSNQQPEAYKNKVITRLWLSSTIGEAIVIVNEVMGNGIIPTLTMNQLEYKGA